MSYIDKILFNQNCQYQTILLWEPHFLFNKFYIRVICPLPDEEKIETASLRCARKKNIPSPFRREQKNFPSDYLLITQSKTKFITNSTLPYESTFIILISHPQSSRKKRVTKLKSSNQRQSLHAEREEEPCSRTAQIARVYKSIRASSAGSNVACEIRE